MIIDASNLVLGRMASFAAKAALGGQEVVIVNCEKAVITGKKRDIVAKHMQRFELGQPQQGPFFPKRPDLFVRRVVRGMLPRKRQLGKEAFGRVKCFVSVPEGLSGTPESLAKADVKNAKTAYYVSVKDLCRLIGGKV